MKHRVLALAILFVGLLPSMTVWQAGAMPSQADMQRHCRAQLGYGPTDPLSGSAVYLLRRCITTTTKQYQAAERIEQQQMRADQQFWGRWEHGQEFVRQSARSIRRQQETQEAVRERYYKTTSLEQRDVLLRQHRRQRRQEVRLLEQQQLREQQEKMERWRQATATCRTYPRVTQQACINALLRQ